MCMTAAILSEPKIEFLNITTNISHNINLFQTQNMKQYWQKRSGNGRNMILIRSGKRRNIILIRAQLNRWKILLIADRAQIDRLLILWRACQEREGRDKSVSGTQLDRHWSKGAAGIKSPPLYPRSARSFEALVKTFLRSPCSNCDLARL